MPMAPYVSGDSAGQCHEGSLVAYVHQCQWPLGVVHNSSKWRSYRRNRTAVARKGIVMPVVDEARAKFKCTNNLQVLPSSSLRHRIRL